MTQGLKERPILFSGPMVRAILDGKKTQTRRVMKPQPTPREDGTHSWICNAVRSSVGVEDVLQAGSPQWESFAASVCPYGQLGDRLWVREGFVYRYKHDRYYYRADHQNFDPYAHGGWKPSIHMPRSACRINLEVISVRVERIQDISEEDAVAEGIQTMGPAALTDRTSFGKLWDSINATRGYGWDKNPWVWVVDFKKVTDG